MAKLRVRNSQLNGTLAIPASKSHTIRALLFALMAQGESRILRYLHSPDTSAMIEAIRMLGARVDVSVQEIKIDGVGGKLQAPDNVIDCGNSGQVLRFIGALAGLVPAYTVLTGDHSIRHNRPVKPLLSALQELGAFAVSSRLDGYAPILIKGPLKGRKAALYGEDSQPVSGLIIAGAFSADGIELEVKNPGEKPWIDLTLSWLDRFKIPYENHNYEKYKISGGAKIDGFTYSVPGDFSSAAFPIAAALITGSELVLGGLDLNDIQGDKKILRVLEKMGARFDTGSHGLKVKKTSKLKGIQIDVNDLIDALPILAVVGCFAEGETEIVNGAIARKKESDRIRCICMELKKMGADIEERPDGLLIRKSRLKGTSLQSHRDHRLAMSLSVAALAADGESEIHGIEAIEKSYASFASDFCSLGAKMEREE